MTKDQIRAEKLQILSEIKIRYGLSPNEQYLDAILDPRLCLREDPYLIMGLYLNPGPIDDLTAYVEAIFYDMRGMLCDRLRENYRNLFDSSESLIPPPDLIAKANEWAFLDHKQMDDEKPCSSMATKAARRQQKFIAACGELTVEHKFPECKDKILDMTADQEAADRGDYKKPDLHKMSVDDLPIWGGVKTVSSNKNVLHVVEPDTDVFQIFCIVDSNRKMKADKCSILGYASASEINEHLDSWLLREKSLFYKTDKWGKRKSKNMKIKLGFHGYHLLKHIHSIEQMVRDIRMTSPTLAANI